MIWSPETMATLAALREQFDVGYGKIAQKLLGLAFVECGASALTERSVQGIDLEVEIDARRLAIEVKTTESEAVQLDRKDVDGLLARRDAGAEPHVAVLGFRPLDRWIVARFHPVEFTAGRKVPLDALRAWRRPGLEARLWPAFVKVVAQFGGEVARGGPGVLDAALRAGPAYRLA